ncbi:hypothetical protein CO038_03500 [Candidatus Pacearchaeota archaeon CG_4_9_14_0_2_um_filter_39_13]|nr:TrmB family transcriptional regulator [Candidatus Pacearchaeota archaeon]OIO43601.1 MAG: hypothetical protein AUJ64_01985 [Candidatus Pacearchaeota archaeon CG1_02_39_14]PJC44483.1 MAG: hypothetical protein CO038_03500 [Candidatus Pacearchaeota archaeon CG_4_9_14_0_2_um_filter_39_13]
MIVKPELVKKIKDHFNLNIYETKVWLALLSKGVVSVGETAELSGVPRSRTYDVLESLAKRGFAIIKIGKPVKYIAVEPKAIIEKMKSNVLTEANEKVKTLSGLSEREEYKELEQLYTTGISPVRAEDLSGALKGRNHVSSKIKEIFGNTKKEVSICTSASDFEKRSRMFLPELEILKNRNIKINIALSGHESEIKKINSKYGIKARPTLNKGRFVISDKRESLFMITHENTDEEIGLWVSAPFFSESLHNMFEISLR